jgi:hypothetical protein
MRKLLVLVLVLPLLGGCAGAAEKVLNLPTGVLTQSVQNPITREHLYRLENGLVVGVSALQSYKNLCENGTLQSNCIQVVATMQTYVRRARPLLRQLRVFVRKNDQVNAKVVYQNVQQLIAEFRGTAAQYGIQIPAGAGGV